MGVVMPYELTVAMEKGEISEEQLRTLIGLEAEALGLTFDSAVLRARSGELPSTPMGADLDLLIQMLLR